MGWESEFGIMLGLKNKIRALERIILKLLDGEKLNEEEMKLVHSFREFNK